MLPDTTLLWQDVSNKEGNLLDYAADIAVKGDRVFVVGDSETTAGSSAFAVRAYDSKNGALLWESNYDREGEGFDEATHVVVGDDKVFVSGATVTAAGGNALAVRAYNAKNGKLLWENNYDREGDLFDMSWGMTVQGNRVFAVGTTETAASGTAFAVRALDATNGNLLWQDNYDREVGVSLWDVAFRAVAEGNRVFVVGQTGSTAGGSAFAVRTYDVTNGNLLWQDNYDREGEGYDWAYETVVDGNKLFVVGGTETAAGGTAFAVRAYDIRNGNLLWQDNYDREGSLYDATWGVAVRGGRLFVVGESETAAGGSAYAIRAYKTSNGNLLWEDYYDREGSFRDTALEVAVECNKVYTVGGTETASGNAYTVRAYNAKDGKLVYEDYQTPEPSLEAPLFWNWGTAIATEGNRVLTAGVTETTAGGLGLTVRAYKAQECDDNGDDDHGDDGDDDDDDDHGDDDDDDDHHNDDGDDDHGDDDDGDDHHDHHDYHADDHHNDHDDDHRNPGVDHRNDHADDDDDDDHHKDDGDGKKKS
ncbi:MAG: PQQ-binding-like beta-propeller repeat protein [Planctomycetes bacterium]|nr:PQQ-binding-like beta-propeller repeat protein [Planctomycetota bacterium]